MGLTKRLANKVLLCIGFALISQGEIMELIRDGSFESLSSTAPNEDTSPWAVIDEHDDTWPVTLNTHQSAGYRTNVYYSGTQSVCYNWNSTEIKVYQIITPALFDSSKIYEGSFRMYSYDDGKGYAGSSTLAFNMFVSGDGLSWGYVAGFASGVSNSTADVWEQVTGTIDGSDYSRYDGYVMRIQIVKYGGTASQYDIAIDDVSMTIITNAPVVPDVFSIAADAGTVVTSATNLSAAAINTLQYKTYLSEVSWSNLSTVAGVTAARWIIPAENQTFFRLETTE